ncbi:hypothetical protein YC2023_092358 [Brassica napus]
MAGAVINGRLVEALIPQLTFSVLGFGVKTRRLESLGGDGVFVGSDCVSPGDGGFSRFIDAGLSARGWRLSQIHRRRSSFREGRLLQLLLCRLMNNGFESEFVGRDAWRRRR